MIFQEYLGVCIPQTPALCLDPGPGLGPQSVFTGPGPHFVFTGPGPHFVFSGPGPHSVFTGPGPHFVFSGPGPQYVFNGSGPQFVFTSPGQSGPWACLYQHCPPNLYLLALAHDFYYSALNLQLPSYL